jgi:hypothetical protein
VAKVKVPDHISNAARRALKWRADGAKGGTSTGVASARAFASGSVDEGLIIKASAWFARHGAQPKGKGWGDTDEPTPKRVSWGLWGDSGDDRGRKWIDTRAAKIRLARGESIARAERGPRLPASVRKYLAPPQTQDDGSVIYEAVIMHRDVLDFDGVKIARADEALGALSRSGDLDGLEVVRGPSHPPLNASTGRFERTSTPTVGTIIGSRYEREPGLLIGRMRVWSAGDQSETERALDGVSLGYYPTEIDEPGELDGRPYDRMVVRIRPDHLVTTDNPRGGNIAATRTETGGDIMPKLLIHGREMDAREIEELIDRLKKEAEDARGEMDGEKRQREEMRENYMRSMEESGAARAEAIGLRKEIEELRQKNKDGLRLRLQSRAEAADVLGCKAVDLLDTDDADLHRQVITHVYGEAFAKDLKDAELVGAYKLCISNADRAKRAKAEANTQQPEIKPRGESGKRRSLSII